MKKMEKNETDAVVVDTLTCARSYQLEALEKSLERNTIVFLETGSGKTLIAIMLIRCHAYLLRKPSPFISVFLVPLVVLIKQQADAILTHTDLKVGIFYGEMGVDYWDAATWDEELKKYEVFVMTPAILLNCLRHGFFSLSLIKLLIFDECHHAKGKHPYAGIMTEFYHPHQENSSDYLPRIFGMTASPIQTKDLHSADEYWQKISDLESLMNSKVYTCSDLSVLDDFIPFSTTKFRWYEDSNQSSYLYSSLKDSLANLLKKHEVSVSQSNLDEDTINSLCSKMKKLYSIYIFCLEELGSWMALKAAQYYAQDENAVLCWSNVYLFNKTIVQDFNKDVFDMLKTHIPAQDTIVSTDLKEALDSGLLTSKVVCLIETVMNYSHLQDLRCIVFAERIVTSVVLSNLLNSLSIMSGWKTEYIAGSNYASPIQSRKEHSRIVEEFRRGNVNIIVATSILEEGLDVQRCNLVIRFDPASNICSFIQSKGRARMKNSDFILMVKRGDNNMSSRVQSFLSSGSIMREESLRHSYDPCLPLDGELINEEFYRVKSTGAMVNLTHSIHLIYFYCSRLPCDGYFKSSPRFLIDQDAGICTLYLPNNSPIQSIQVQGSGKLLKKVACLEACKQLHMIGALTDYLVPDIDAEEKALHQSDNFDYDEEKACYFPPMLVNCSDKSTTTYYCYLIDFRDISIQNVFLLVRVELELDSESNYFQLCSGEEKIIVWIIFAGRIHLNSQRVSLCRKFNSIIFQVLKKHSLDGFEDMDISNSGEVIDYFVLPSTTRGKEETHIIDWDCIRSVSFSSGVSCKHKKSVHSSNCSYWIVETTMGRVCSCALSDCVVLTPHNGFLYHVSGFLPNLNSNSPLRLSDGSVVTYKDHYQSRYGIHLNFEQVNLLSGRRIFTIHNWFQRCRKFKNFHMYRPKINSGECSSFVEIPPELCSILMSPLSVQTLYSFTFIPTVMHMIESLLIAVSFRKMQHDAPGLNIKIPVRKVLEAITTKKCRNDFHLESLESLGDSFLKYATSQHLFKTHQGQHEGILSLKKDRIISNASLCKLGCQKNIPGFIRNEPFNPQSWPIPGMSVKDFQKEEMSGTTMFVIKKRPIKYKVVADVVEALIGVFLTSGGEAAAVAFMCWLGIEVDLLIVPYVRHFPFPAEKLINVDHLQSLLNYKFRDTSLILEALTHGSYMLPQVPRCYQRLEFLGDSVLDYLMTRHLDTQHPEMSPGMLTDLRSAAVNNDCYARSAVRAGLEKHILYLSRQLHNHIITTVENFEKLSAQVTYGWDSESYFPKVLGDVIESLAGAIYVDSDNNNEVVFNSMRHLLDPLITPQTLKLHPVRELNELCQKRHYTMKKSSIVVQNGVLHITVEVDANGITHKHTSTASDKAIAKKLASREVLMSIKASTMETD